VLLLAAAAARRLLVAAPFAPLLARYRGIFFAMLTLALSMVLYGLLVKTETLGGSDGFNVSRPDAVRLEAPTPGAHYLLWAVTAGIVCLLTGLVRIYCDSQRGLVSLACATTSCAWSTSAPRLPTSSPGTT
jgi:branched-chain amino acid transport system permease protein